jgi:predicted small lipoprotein YifL
VTAGRGIRAAAVALALAVVAGCGLGGPQAARQPGASAADRAFPATEEILDFFARHERTPR